MVAGFSENIELLTRHLQDGGKNLNFVFTYHYKTIKIKLFI